MKLFECVGRQVCLNESGEILYGYTTKIFERVRQASEQINSLNGMVWGDVQIGATNTPGSYIMPRILRQFKKLHLTSGVGNGYEIGEMIHHNEIDFAIMSGGPARTEGLNDVEKLYTDQAVLVGSPDHWMAGRSRRKPVLTEEWAGETYITRAPHSALYQLMERILDELELPSCGASAGFSRRSYQDT